MNPSDRRHAGSDVERPSHQVDSAVREDLDRARLEHALARRDASSEVMSAIQAAGPVDLGELNAAVERLEGTVVPSLVEFENLLASPDASLIRVEGNLLADLLNEGVEGQAVLRRGIAFLKHRKYASALEWWSLNRRGLAPETSKLHLLLSIMEALTLHWSGDGSEAEAAMRRVRAHPQFSGRAGHDPTQRGASGP
jgi:hypothetical protein